MGFTVVIINMYPENSLLKRKKLVREVAWYLPCKSKKLYKEEKKKE